MDEELHVQRLRFAERIELGRRQVWHEGHVGFVDSGESSDGRTIESESFVDDVFIESIGWNGEVLLDAGDIREANVDELDVVIFDVCGDIFSISESHCDSSQISLGRSGISVSDRALLSTLK